MRRVSVVGTSGSGKTTTARRLAVGLGVPLLELDAVFHQPGWNPLPDADFRDAVDRFIATDAWVVDGNYASAGVLDAVWDRADTVVWLDRPRWVVMFRITARTVRRALTRQELWNGNTERWRNLASWDPERNIIRWAWTRFDSTRDRYTARSEDPRWSSLTFIRLRTDDDVDALISAIG